MRAHDRIRAGLAVNAKRLRWPEDRQSSPPPSSERMTEKFPAVTLALIPFPRPPLPVHPETRLRPSRQSGLRVHGAPLHRLTR